MKQMWIFFIFVLLCFFIFMVFVMKASAKDILDDGDYSQPDPLVSGQTTIWSKDLQQKNRVQKDRLESERYIIRGLDLQKKGTVRRDMIDPNRNNFSKGYLYRSE